MSVRNTRLTEEEAKKIFDLLMGGNSITEIAQIMYPEEDIKYARTRVYSCEVAIKKGRLLSKNEADMIYLNSTRIKQIATRNRRKSSRKFTDIQVIEICKLLMNGETYPTIASRYNCSKDDIKGILELSAYSDISSNVEGFEEFAYKRAKTRRLNGRKKFTNEELDIIGSAYVNGKNPRETCELLSQSFGRDYSNEMTLVGRYFAAIYSKQYGHIPHRLMCYIDKRTDENAIKCANKLGMISHAERDEINRDKNIAMVKSAIMASSDKKICAIRLGYDIFGESHHMNKVFCNHINRYLDIMKNENDPDYDMVYAKWKSYSNRGYGIANPETLDLIRTMVEFGYTVREIAITLNIYDLQTLRHFIDAL